jgi:hypothetical protein
MEDPSAIPSSSPNDGADQGSKQDCGEALCRSEVPGPSEGDCHWTSRPGCDLAPEKFYRVKGSCLNTLYRTAVTNFNRTADRYEKESILFTYSEAFWNGYGCAIASVRDLARDFPLSSEVQ